VAEDEWAQVVQLAYKAGERTPHTDDIARGLEQRTRLDVRVDSWCIAVYGNAPTFDHLWATVEQALPPGWEDEFHPPMAPEAGA
jgi:hypothetical protein